MNLDLILLQKILINKEVLDVLALITLELNDLAKFLVLHNIPVTAEIFLESLEDPFVAQLFRQTLDCSQALLSIPLLYAYVHILFGPSATGLFGIGKWIESARNLDL